MKLQLRKFAFACLSSLALMGVAQSAGAQAIPRPDHVVVVMFENTTYADMMGKTDPVTGAPYINSLRAVAANMTRSTGTGHPTDPNYVNFSRDQIKGLLAIQIHAIRAGRNSRRRIWQHSYSPQV